VAASAGSIRAWLEINKRGARLRLLLRPWREGDGIALILNRQANHNKDKKYGNNRNHDNGCYFPGGSGRRQSGILRFKLRISAR